MKRRGSRSWEPHVLFASSLRRQNRFRRQGSERQEHNQSVRVQRGGLATFAARKYTWSTNINLPTPPSSPTTLNSQSKRNWTNKSAMTFRSTCLFLFLSFFLLLVVEHLMYYLLAAPIVPPRSLHPSLPPSLPLSLPLLMHTLFSFHSANRTASPRLVTSASAPPHAHTTPPPSPPTRGRKRRKGGRKGTKTLLVFQHHRHRLIHARIRNTQNLPTPRQQLPYLLPQIPPRCHL